MTSVGELEAELASWVNGTHSWADEHHGRDDAFEATAKADEAQIRYLMARVEAARLLAGTTATTATHCAEHGDLLADDKKSRRCAQAPAGHEHPTTPNNAALAGAWLAGFGVGERSGAREFPLNAQAENPFLKLNPPDADAHLR